MFRSCNRLLCRGFQDIKKRLSTTNLVLKSRMPRRSSQRDNHPLESHVRGVQSIYISLYTLPRQIQQQDRFRFYTGKVIDEINRLLNFLDNSSERFDSVFSTTNLHDIVVMAKEHFVYKIAPRLEAEKRIAAINQPHSQSTITFPQLVADVRELKNSLKTFCEQHRKDIDELKKNIDELKDQNSQLKAQEERLRKLEAGSNNSSSDSYVLKGSVAKSPDDQMDMSCNSSVTKRKAADSDETPDCKRHTSQ